MNYAEALKYIEQIEYFGSKPGLERISALMEVLGNPQDALKVIHVAGTNGKGSTTAMLTYILKENGYRVGTYTSPHLESYNERFMINGENISDEKLARYVTLIKEACEGLEDKPTVFEVLTAVAFKYFFDEKVDYVVLEVGLGGRFDATNLINKPVLSVITSISFDHVEFLGDTLEKIAFEKAGIIKEGCPCVLYRQSDEVRSVIEAVCKEKNSAFYYTDEQEVTVLKQDITGTVFSVKNRYVDIKNVSIKLIGDYQIKNACLVLLAAEALRLNGVELKDSLILSGVERSKWHGRMEIVGEDPTVLLDGAHNLDGIAMLSDSLKKYFADRKITLLVGILGDKEYGKMVETIAPLASNIVLTEPRSERKWHLESLEEFENMGGIKVYKESDIKKALDLAFSVTEKEDVICCAGSFYLIGEIYKLVGYKL
ncbi:MAG: bifunctional folylpolyglutamate synthase/dihydrofolate synthase [Lachnospiraceae bacterium]|nr:bifunctional folylpolyglutamate synthase/dihydrofolate synthase [Lachnospiraceae bacterium]